MPFIVFFDGKHFFSSALPALMWVCSVQCLLYVYVCVFLLLCIGRVISHYSCVVLVLCKNLTQSGFRKWPLLDLPLSTICTNGLQVMGHFNFPRLCVHAGHVHSCLHNKTLCTFNTFFSISMATHVTARDRHVTRVSKFYTSRKTKCFYYSKTTMYLLEEAMSSLLYALFKQTADMLLQNQENVI